ncbi:MAG TPA: hypothetical protein VJ577_20910 [Burkholderiaceae bacterium]|nr:hypothetical protein [Burkholderiaceae bacterium]
MKIIFAPHFHYINNAKTRQSPHFLAPALHCLAGLRWQSLPQFIYAHLLTTLGWTRICFEKDQPYLVTF